RLRADNRHDANYVMRVLSPSVNAESFLFSSRRRHTRWPRDWSSDVCSSDLRFCSIQETTSGPSVLSSWRRRAAIALPDSQQDLRSEERRVGKECRSEGAAQH